MIDEVKHWSQDTQGRTSVVLAKPIGASLHNIQSILTQAPSRSFVHVLYCMCSVVDRIQGLQQDFDRVSTREEGCVYGQF
jgi:hypothetical protein